MKLNLRDVSAWRLLLVVVALVLFTVACSSEPAAEPEEVAVVEEVPTETNTPEPTETNTPEPTETNTPEPTATHTPTATFTPTATNTPTETPTNTPTSTPTNTPTATFTPTVTNTPVPLNTPTPEASATPDTITLFYASNPSDILGTFPVREFSADGIRGNMNLIRGSLQTMRNNLDGARNGEAAACDAYVGGYNNILYSGVFYDPVPGDWQEIDNIYVISFIYSLDRTRPAYLSCVNAGTVDDFNASLARQTIDETLAFIQPAIDAAAVK